MPNMKQLIARYMQTVTLILVVVILAVASAVQLLSAQNYAKESAEAVFVQIRQIMAENNAELVTVQEEYRQTCLHNAQAIAYIVESNPDILENVSEMQKVAKLMEVDEIHFFDEKGCIFSGTHEEYYGITMESGEQISYFEPMLRDKSMSLVQEVTPNTAEGKPMQYSAVWSKNGKFIVQVGMEPDHVMQATQKNELSYVFSLLRVNTGVSLYAIDKETGEIKGSTAIEDVGKNCSEIGFELEQIIERGEAFHTHVKGVNSFCVFTEVDNNLIGRVVSADTLYHNVTQNMLALGGCLLLVTIILIVAVIRYMNRNVISGIYDINEKLSAITEGNLDEKVDVQTCREFLELSNHSNEMIKSLLAGTEKISYVLNKTDVPIGVYEYNKKMAKVRYTEHVPGILSLSKTASKQLLEDSTKFIAYIEAVKSNPVQEEEDVYYLPDKNKYIRLEELVRNNDVLGIVIDITEEIQKRRLIEEERDTDILTGLYNRRGLENRLEELFANPTALKYCAMVMLDADCLKEINDKYGHDNGDIYLRKIAGVLNSYGPNSCVIARQGGDEFVLFLYEYESEKELEDTINTLRFVQDNSIAHLNDNVSVPLKFSYGYYLSENETDYMKMLKIADQKMYENKKKRKMIRKV